MPDPDPRPYNAAAGPAAPRTPERAASRAAPLTLLAASAHASSRAETGLSSPGVPKTSQSPSPSSPRALTQPTMSESSSYGAARPGLVPSACAPSRGSELGGVGGVDSEREDEDGLPVVQFASCARPAVLTAQTWSIEEKKVRARCCGAARDGRRLAHYSLPYQVRRADGEWEYTTKASRQQVRSSP